MGITGKHIEIGVKIMHLVLEAQGVKSPTVTDITNRAYKVATVIIAEPAVAEKLRDAIINRMITIKVEII